MTLRDHQATQIIAGPGTGKTTELVNRISAEISQVGNEHKNIIVCTFTRKAADELVQRIEEKIGLTGEGSGRLLIGTIHSICLTLLRDLIPQEYLDWDVLAEANQVPYVHSKLTMLGFGESEVRGQASWDFAREISRIYTTITDEQISLGPIFNRVAKQVSNSEPSEDPPLIERILENYDFYLDSLEEDRLFDYSTIQQRFLYALKNVVSFSKLISDRFQTVFVDEYQDVNDIQNEIFFELFSLGLNLVVVGDDDQSIYGFRGGKVDHLVNFKNNVIQIGGKCESYHLADNYRSTNQIVDATTRFINLQSYPRLEKKLKSFRDIDGPSVMFSQFDSDVDEANWIVDQIKTLRLSQKITSFRSIGILLGSVKNHGATIKRALAKSNVPVQSFGAGTLFEYGFSQEFLGLFDFWLGRDLSDMERMQKLQQRLEGQALEQYDEAGLFKNLFELIRSKKFYGSSLALMYDLFAATSFIERHNVHGKNVGQLTSLVHAYDSNARKYDPFGLYSFLCHTAKQADVDYVDDNYRDAVQLMTIHRSKGLEFDVVFVASQNSRQRPGSTLFDDFSELAGRPAEVRGESERALYVAMTRARNMLTVSSSKTLEGRKKSYSWSEPAAQALASCDYRDGKKEFTLSPSEFTNFSVKTGPRPVLSYNALRLYRTCPLQYRFSHVDRLETVRIGGMQFGVNMHRVIEHLLRIKQNETVSDRSVVDQLVEKYWRDLPTRPDQENSKFRNSGKKQLYGFVDNFLADLKSEDIAGIEEPFTFMIDDWRVVGRLDLLLNKGGTVEIVDFKTGESDDYRSQLNFYAACVEKTSGHMPETVKIYYLKTGELNSYTPTSPSDEIEALRLTADRIGSNDFDPNPGKWCSDCAYSSICEFKHSTTLKLSNTK